MRGFVRFLGCALLVLATSPAVAGVIDADEADSYFADVAALCAKDDGALWGRSLCGSILFVDPVTREIVSNQETEGLEKAGPVWAGRLPDGLPVANTGMDWNGQRWTMVMWPLPADRFDRNRLILHEAWHRIQDDLGLPMTNPANAHLDTREGRMWLRLEWVALARAIESEGEERRFHAHRAITFRGHRQELFPGSHREEVLLEMNEGLAEDTGFVLAGMNGEDRVAKTLEHLKAYASSESFVRNFAYASGPAYGLLLDFTNKDWRKNVSPSSDYGRLLASAYDLEIPTRPSVVARRVYHLYDGEKIGDEERERSAQREERLKGFRKQFEEGRTLLLPLRSPQMEFDPDTLTSYGKIGTVYQGITMRDEWGTLTSTGNVLVDATFTWAKIPFPEEIDLSTRKTDEWTLDLGEGWSTTQSQTDDIQLASPPPNEN